MAKITTELIQELRKKTGIGMMDCKKALTEADGDIEKAIELLRKKGEKVALKRADNATAHGTVCAYIHPGSNLGVLIEINCETDFSANTDTMRDFARDVCMQIAACNPISISSDEVDAALIAKEREIFKAQLKESGKPDGVIDKIVDGKIQKFYETACLLDQPFIKNDKVRVRDLLNELMAKIGENIKIKRFVRFEVGA